MLHMYLYTIYFIVLIVLQNDFCLLNLQVSDIFRRKEEIKIS